MRPTSMPDCACPNYCAFSLTRNTLPTLSPQSAQNKYRSDPRHSLASTWLKALFRLDAKQGARELLASLTGRRRLDDDKAQAMLATVFGDTSDERHQFVGQLTRRQDRHSRSRPARPQPRVTSSALPMIAVTSAFTRRTHVTGRNVLATSSSLPCATHPGREAYEAILELAARHEFAGIAGRLRTRGSSKGLSGRGVSTG